MTDPIPVDSWTLVTIQQVLVGYEYVHTIAINTVVVNEVVNEIPLTFDDVTIWGSDPYHTTSAANIRNFQFGSLSNTPVSSVQ